MNQHVIIQIEGRVQGVWFRQSAKNNEDGTVTIEVCIAKMALDKMIQWCERGSKMSDVQNVHYTINDECKQYNDFKVL